MKLTYTFDIDDWTSFQRYHYGMSPLYRRTRNITRILLPVAVLLLLAARFSSRGFDPLYFGIFAVVSVAWFMFYPRWFDRKVIRRGSQFLEEGNNDNMFGPREIELLPDKVRITSPTCELTYRASAITKTVETPDALLLYVSSIQALILPRRKVSEADFQQAATFAQQHYARPAA